MQTGLDACRAGHYLCVLPDLVARDAGLRRLDFEDLEPTTLYLLHRRSLTLPGRTELAAAAIREHANRCLNEKTAGS
jgi:DNA-binding transcriptional LysR family regulator